MSEDMKAFEKFYEETTERHADFASDWERAIWVSALSHAESKNQEEVNRWKAAYDSAFNQAIENGKKLLASKATIAMLIDGYKRIHESSDYKMMDGDLAREIARQQLSASPESVAAWEAEKLLPMQRQVAMLVDIVNILLTTKPSVEFDLAIHDAKQILSNTQATAEDYERQHAAKVLEEAAGWNKFGDGYVHRNTLLAKAEELRAANKKE